MVSLRSSSALGDFHDLEDQIREVKSDILKRGYTYGDGLTAADLTAQLQELSSQLTALNQRSASATTRVTASQSGIFSSLVDGYETTLTPSAVMTMTPSQLTALMTGGGGASSSTGKLITSNRWYFACVLPLASAQRLSEGGTALLRFTGEFTQDVDMTVSHISEAEGDKAVVVFSTDPSTSPATTLLRTQTAEPHL